VTGGSGVGGGSPTGGWKSRIPLAVVGVVAVVVGVLAITSGVRGLLGGGDLAAVCGEQAGVLRDAVDRMTVAGEQLGDPSRDEAAQLASARELVGGMADSIASVAAVYDAAGGGSAAAEARDVVASLRGLADRVGSGDVASMDSFQAQFLELGGRLSDIEVRSGLEDSIADEPGCADFMGAVESFSL
jgi:hypothetical protein